MVMGLRSHPLRTSTYFAFWGYQPRPVSFRFIFAPNPIRSSYCIEIKATALLIPYPLLRLW